jgi:hypothetical protein
MGMNQTQLAPSGAGGGQGGAKGQQQANQNAQTNSMMTGRTSGYIKGIAEIEARKKLNETAAGLSEITSKTQFQALIIQMFLQRRFEHAVIACRFYPNLFKDGESVSFENLVARRDVDSASNRLLEAFGVGEYLPRIRRLPMSEKTKILDFVRKKNKLLGFLEMKDYANAETVVNDLRAISEDFEYAKPLAVIQTAKSVSSLIRRSWRPK